MASSVVTVRAHAKVNLSLRVGPRRRDGFHELHTVYQALALHDTLRFARRRGPFSLSSSAPGVPIDTSNLIYQAAEALWRRLGRTGDPRDLAIRLQKRIPMQAGLGGGSSDAAATLVALNRFWTGRLAREALVEIAATLGSDVPFFLLGGTALGVGRGEIVQPMPDAPPRAVVLVRPDVRVSTAEAYGWFDSDTRLVTPVSPTAPAPAGDGWPGPIMNDLEAPVVRRRPEIGAARQALLDAGALVAGMAGSGSVVFGLFDRPDRAQAAARGLRRSRWTVIVTRTLGRGEYERRARAARPRAGSSSAGR